MDAKSKQDTSGEDLYRLWRAQHVCWVTKRAIKNRLLTCSCGFSKPIDSYEAARKRQAEHLQTTRPEGAWPGARGALIGHWYFLSQPGGNSLRKTWICTCGLCGYKTQLTDSSGNLLPLTGNLYLRRRNHDAGYHSNRFHEQRIAEETVLGNSLDSGSFDVEVKPLDW